MFKKVVQVRANSDFTVTVYFSEGEIRRFDVKPLIARGGVFLKISKIEDFMAKCTVMNDTLAWDLSGERDDTTCIDLDPTSVFHEGIALKEPLDS